GCQSPSGGQAASGAASEDSPAGRDRWDVSPFSGRSGTWRRTGCAGLASGLLRGINHGDLRALLQPFDDGQAFGYVAHLDFAGVETAAGFHIYSGLAVFLKHGLPWNVQRMFQRI